MKEGLVEKTIRKNRVVYVLSLDEEKLFNQFKRLSFDLLVKKFQQTLPEISILMNLYTRILAKSYILDKTSMLEDEELTQDEIDEKHLTWKLELLSDNELELLSKSKIREIRNEFYELRRMKR